MENTIIDLDEIKFKQMGKQRLESFQAASAQGFNSFDFYLTHAEREYLDGIFARTLRKYNVGGTDFLNLIEEPKVLTHEEAVELARDQLIRKSEVQLEQLHSNIARRTERALKQYESRVAQIKTDATRRGMQNSTVVLSQLDRAARAKDAEIDFIEQDRELRSERIKLTADARVEALGKRIHADSMRTNIQVLREKSAQHSRSYRDWLQFQHARLTLPINTQATAEQEIYDRILEFMLTLPPRRAANIVDNDPVFFFNLTPVQYSRMFTELTRRAITLLRP